MYDGGGGLRVGTGARAADDVVAAVTAADAAGAAGGGNGGADCCDIMGVPLLLTLFSCDVLAVLA